MDKLMLKVKVELWLFLLIKVKLWCVGVRSLYVGVFITEEIVSFIGEIFCATVLLKIDSITLYDQRFNLNILT